MGCLPARSSGNVTLTRATCRSDSAADPRARGTRLAPSWASLCSQTGFVQAIPLASTSGASDCRSLAGPGVMRAAGIEEFGWRRGSAGAASGTFAARSPAAAGTLLGRTPEITVSLGGGSSGNAGGGSAT